MCRRNGSGVPANERHRDVALFVMATRIVRAGGFGSLIHGAEHGKRERLRRHFETDTTSRIPSPTTWSMSQKSFSPLTQAGATRQSKIRSAIMERRGTTVARMAACLNFPETRLLPYWVPE